MKYLKHYRVEQFLGRDTGVNTTISMGANAEILSVCGQIEYDKPNDTLCISVLENEMEEPKAKYRILTIAVRHSGRTEIAEDFKFINSVQLASREYLVFYKKLN